jgi:Flp pilus assembly protein TadB
MVREAEMARALGLAKPRRRWDPNAWALRTGTGLTFRQIVLGAAAWAGGGLLIGILVFSPLIGLVFALSGAIFYLIGLVNRREEHRLHEAEDINGALAAIDTALSQGSTLTTALEQATTSIGPDGERILRDLLIRLRQAPAQQQSQAVAEWQAAWDNPAVAILATALQASYTGNILIGPIVAGLRQTLGDVVGVLSRARAAAAGVEWQARFLALFPTGILLFLAFSDPSMGAILRSRPSLALPALAGSVASYLLSTHSVRQGLSIAASLAMGNTAGGDLTVAERGASRSF